MTATLSDGFVSFANGNSSAKVALQGATVISYVHSGTEHLFTSAKSALKGPAAIRGGIPIVFPCFGPPPADDAAFSKLKQHGFARISQWQYEGEASDLEQGDVGLQFSLKPTSDIKALFDGDFALLYTVILEKAGSLKTILKVTNPSKSSTLKFQTLFHTYFRLPEGIEPKDVTVEGLDGVAYVDKVAKNNNQQKGPVSFNGEVDSVYPSAADTLTIARGSQAILQVTKNNFPDVVVWNPHKAKSDALGDMEADGWLRYVCVEPGHATKFVHLEPNSSSTSWQRITPKL